jgi:hypothetical protein
VALKQDTFFNFIFGGFISGGRLSDAELQVQPPGLGRKIRKSAMPATMMTTMMMSSNGLEKPVLSSGGLGGESMADWMRGFGERTRQKKYWLLFGNEFSRRRWHKWRCRWIYSGFIRTHSSIKCTKDGHPPKEDDLSRSR